MAYTTITSNVVYPPEPETYDLAIIASCYTHIQQLENLIKWRQEWEKRLKETSGHWHARPRMCQLHLDAVKAEIAKRDNQLKLL